MTLNINWLVSFSPCLRSSGSWRKFQHPIKFFTPHNNNNYCSSKATTFFLKKSCMSKNPSILVLAFKTYIIPILEYCSPVWSPHNLADVRRIESVQRLFTKKLLGYKGQSYPARLERAKLCTLELRRVRADLCLCYNILHKNVDTTISDFFSN